jgi:uncharacterized protein (TIGR02246 family)
MNTAARLASLVCLGLVAFVFAEDPGPATATPPPAGTLRQIARERVLARTGQTGVLNVAALRIRLARQVRKEIKQFEQAFNAHDAKAVAAQWSPQGVYLDDRGTEYKGRENIEKLYAALFAEHSNVQAVTTVEDVRIVNAFTAIEQGCTAVTLTPGSEPSMGRYIATHVRKDKKWLMVSVEDLPDVQQVAASAVQDLAWLIGTWHAATPLLSMETSYQYVCDGAFLQRTWVTRGGTNIISQGMQLIGWDAPTAQLASWTYDALGSIDKGLWVPDQQGWEIRATGALRNGTPFSATYLMQRTGDNTMTVNSINRFVADVALPEFPELTFTRTPATP